MCNLCLTVWYIALALPFGAELSLIDIIFLT